MAISNKHSGIAEQKLNQTTCEAEPNNPDRRDFLKKSGLATLGMAGAAMLFSKTVIAAKDHSNHSHHAHKDNVSNEAILSKGIIPPGRYDQYYGCWSGGQSGEVRILGIPSMRELKKIPVFNFNCTDGWGITNYSKSLLKDEHSDEILRVGDTHHVHLSYTDGTYDGKYAFVNDKSHGRLARIRLDVFLVDKVTFLPHSQGTHGIFPTRQKNKNYPNAVYCNSEFRNPLPNDGGMLEDSHHYGCLHSCVDQETMKVRWQCWVEGNMDLVATDYQGKYSMATCYNSEDGVVLADMMANDMDWLTVFDLEEIERAVAKWRNSSHKKVYASSEEVYAKLTKKDGHPTIFSIKGYEDIPIIDGRSRQHGKLTRGAGTQYTQYIPIPKSPHGVNVDPTGTYAMCAGKLSPTISIISISKFDDLFAGKIKNPRDLVIAEPEVGLGPLHTAFDGRGNAYTSIFLDSLSTKWNIAKAVAGKNPVIQKLDVMYQPGHINATMSETKDAIGDWLVSLNKFSKDRFLPVGPRFDDNDQLIDISLTPGGKERKMQLVHDGAADPEPHDCVIVDSAIIRPHVKQIWDYDDPKMDPERRLLKEAVSKYKAWIKKHPSYKIPKGEDPKVYAFNINLNDLSKNELKNTNFYFTDDNEKVTYAIITAVAPKFGLSEIRTKKGYKVYLSLTNNDSVEDLTHGCNISQHDINFGCDPHESNSVEFIAKKPGVYWIYCTWFCHALHLEMRSRLIVER